MTTVDALQPAPAPVAAPTFAGRLSLFAQDIKLSHTLFAMPWALMSGFVAAGGSPRLGQLGLIVLCMVTARTVAMAANRLVDAELDRANPRTARRAIPSGALSRGFVLFTLLACAAGFIGSTAGFWLVYGNVWPMALSVPVLLFVCAYPLLKRFTRLCHYYLGAALALAPVCAWVAISGRLAAPPLWMAAAVLCWTAGFDIIYACQDYESDLATGVFSVPSKLGIAGALWVARITHVICIAMLVMLGRSVSSFGPLYWSGVAIAVVLLVVEHSLVKPTDLSKVGLAFFTINGVISLVLGALGIADLFL
jgi:4-hydroxybenzoate polyprenyltransferase